MNRAVTVILAIAVGLAAGIPLGGQLMPGEQQAAAPAQTAGFAAVPDTIGAHKGIQPPADGGTILRIIDFPPEPKDPESLRRGLHATFAGMYQDARHDKAGTTHPGMHRTDTIDYAIVLEGEIYAVLDEGETLMRAGDVLIQRGTNHAWANRSDKTARIAFVLIDARR